MTYLPGMEPARIADGPDGEGDEWYTPPAVLAAVAACSRDGMIDLDPCWSPASLVRPRFKIDVRAGGDGLRDPWPGCGLVFCNPPYSNIAPWLARCAGTAAAGRDVIALVPVSVEIGAWWQHVWGRGATVIVQRSRLRFVAPDGQTYAAGKSATCWIAWDRDLALRLVRHLRERGFEALAVGEVER